MYLLTYQLTYSHHQETIDNTDRYYLSTDADGLMTSVREVVTTCNTQTLHKLLTLDQVYSQLIPKSTRPQGKPNPCPNPNVRNWNQELEEI